MKILSLKVLLLYCSTFVILPASASFVTSRVCNFEEGTYCGWNIEISEGEGTYGLVSAGAANGNPRPLTDFNPGNINGSYFYYIKPNNYFNQVLLLSYSSQKYLTNMSFAYYITGPQGLFIRQVHVTEFEINSNLNNNSTNWEQAFIQFSTPSPNSAVIIESPSLPGGGGEAPIEGDPYLGIDDIVLTFTLPCDFSSLSLPGSLMLSHPSFLDITLGQINTVNLMGISTICSQGPFIYTLESNNVTSLGAIFHLNSTTGLLTVNATGGHLIGKGVTLGLISVSVYVEDSNYLQSDETLFKRYGTIHYRQPPTIIISSTADVHVIIGEQFNHIINASSSLNVDLQYSLVQSTPPSLADNITLTNNTVTGIVTHNHLVDIIQLNIQHPSFTVSIIDAYDEVRNYTVQLVLPAQIPLIFNQLQYIFHKSEDTNPISDPLVGDVLVGSIPNLDCNHVNATITTADSTITSTFSLVPLPHTFLTNFCTFRLFLSTSLDYEMRQQYIYNITVHDTDRGRSSITMVTVQVGGVNEFTPVISPKDQSISVSDYETINHLVLSVTGEDQDSGTDGQLTYTITGGNEVYFKLVTISNTLAHLVIKYSPIVPGTYLVEVTVADGGIPPKTDVTMITVSVIASGQIHCNESAFGPPLITEATSLLRLPIYSNIILQCNYTSNPGVYPIQWYRAPLSSPLSYTPLVSNSHYIISSNTLSINRVTSNDISYYTCNVTNQCGSDTRSIPLALIINYPTPPSTLIISDGPTQYSITLSWTPPISTIIEPVSGYWVQLQGEEEERYTTHCILSYYSDDNIKITQITLDNLVPGINYTARVLSVNEYFQSSSNIITFTTLTSAPKLSYFNVSVLYNNGLSIQWELQYTGGSHDLHMTIAVQSEQVTKRRRKRFYIPTSHSYNVNTDDNMLVTPTLPFGQHYNVMGVVSSEYGTSQYQETAFIGIHDTLHCPYTLSSSCNWILGDGSLVQSSLVSPPRPSADATDNSTGIYVLGTVTNSLEEESVILLSYPTLTYICGISFYYQVNTNIRLRLETTQYGNESLIWSSPLGDHTHWTLVDIPIGEFPLSLSRDSLQVTMETTGSPSPILSYAAIDEVTLHFCLPCNYSNLSYDSLSLSYSNYSTLYIRQANQTFTIQTTVNDCSNPILQYSIHTVVPNQLSSMISIPNIRKGDIHISDLTNDMVESGTTGYLIVNVEVLSSDYKNTGTTLAKSAMIHFIISEKFENCSYTKSCDFEDSSSCDWQLSDQSNSSIKQMSNNKILFSRPLGSQLQGGVVNIGHQIINDSYCGLEFSFLSQDVTLQVSVTGIGTVWSDMPTTNYSAHTWRGVSVYVDVGGVPMMSGRRVTFEMISSNGINSFIALDNVTLHPCIDCQAQECSCVSCIQQCSVSPCHHGYYLSLEINQCRACPRGHYCDNWRSLPKACPPGTYNNVTGSYTPKDCQMCPNGTYAVQTGSTSCITCPTGYKCSDPAHIPVAIMMNNDCSLLNTTSNSYTNLGIAAIVGLSAGIILTCLVLSTISCYCCYHKNKKVNKMRKKEHKMYADNFYVNPERHRRGGGGGFKSATVRTASTILSMMGKDTEDGNRAYANPAFDTDSEDGFSQVSILTSTGETRQRDPSINSFQKIDWPDNEPFANSSTANPFSSLEDTKSEMSDMIELEDHDDHVWPALQRKKQKETKEEEEEYYDL